MSVVFYATTCALFGGIFIVRYHLELILFSPFAAGLFAYYLHLGMQRAARSGIRRSCIGSAVSSRISCSVRLCSSCSCSPPSRGCTISSTSTPRRWIRSGRWDDDLGRAGDSVVIPVRDDAARLRRCLERIAAGTPAGVRVEIVVADNGSVDDSAEVARRAGAHALSLPGLRLGELRNHAAAAGRGPVLAFVDADNEIGPAWIPADSRRWPRPRTGRSARRAATLPGDLGERFYDRLRAIPRRRSRSTGSAAGTWRCAAAAFEEVGGFDADLETCEDVDLCRKLRARGYALLADLRLENVHHGDPRTLSQVFFGELWRGRDNVRVSLRPSVVGPHARERHPPVLSLAAGALVLVGLAAYAIGRGARGGGRGVSARARGPAGPRHALASGSGRRRPEPSSGPMDRLDAGPGGRRRVRGRARARRRGALRVPAAPRRLAKTPVIRVLELRSVRGTGGGPEKTILFGAERHDRRRFAMTVCYLRDPRDRVFGVDQRARAMMDYVEVHERHSFDPAIWPRLVVARARRADIVHGHDYKTNLLAWLLARRTGAVPLATSHGWTGHTARERWSTTRPSARSWAGFLACRGLERYPRSARACGRAGRRVTVLLNGIDPDAFRRSRPRANGCAPNWVSRRATTSSARLAASTRKSASTTCSRRSRRSDRAARAAAGHRGRGLAPRIERAAAALGVAARCRFLGHRLDVAALHDAFDSFVQASEYEGTPNAVLEAMAMETPLVATDAGGTPELARRRRADRAARRAPALVGRSPRCSRIRGRPPRRRGARARRTRTVVRRAHAPTRRHL